MGAQASWSASLCRHKAEIVAAYVLSSLLVLCFLALLTQLTLQESKEVATGQGSTGRISDLLKVELRTHVQLVRLLLAVACSRSKHEQPTT